MAQTGRTTNRKALTLMHAHISQEMYNGYKILAYHSNRMFRNRHNACCYKSLYKNYGIKVLYSSVPVIEGAEQMIIIQNY